MMRTTPVKKIHLHPQRNEGKGSKAVIPGQHLQKQGHALGPVRGSQSQGSLGQGPDPDQEVGSQKRNIPPVGQDPDLAQKTKD